MIERIPSHKFSVDTPEIRSILGEIGEVPQEVQQLSKNGYIERIRSDLDSTRFEDHIRELFESYGKKGDKFNLQLFTLPGGVSYNHLKDRVLELEGDHLENIYSSHVSEPLTLEKAQFDDADQTVDIRFKTATRQQDIVPDEDVPVQVLRRDTAEVTDEYGEDYVVRAPHTYTAEVRVYADHGIAAISNSSGVSSGLQTDISGLLIEMGRDTEADNGSE